MPAHIVSFFGTSLFLRGASPPPGLRPAARQRKQHKKGSSLSIS
eukprot:SAG22_NODE_326_length_12283_cov_248.386408_5_plen_44_part_00